MNSPEAASILQDVIAATLDFCSSCQQPLSKADDNYVICLGCEWVLCRNCSSCPCDLYGVPKNDDCVYVTEEVMLSMTQALRNEQRDRQTKQRLVTKTPSKRCS